MPTEDPAEDLPETGRPPPTRPSGIRPRPATTERPPPSERRDTLPTIPDSESADWDQPLTERPTTPAPAIADTLIDELRERSRPAPGKR
jgi:hypothetical protein